MHDVVIRNGTIYDGTGPQPFQGDIAILSDSIIEVSRSVSSRGSLEVDAKGLAVAPGFINMLSWANESLIADGRSQSDIRQGVTLEIMGEGVSMGPFNETMKQTRLREQGDIKYDVTWSKLSQYLNFLVERGVSTNVASFVGATTVRQYVLGDEDRSPSPAELSQMQQLVREAMQAGTQRR